jgi:hypothetical protein
VLPLFSTWYPALAFGLGSQQVHPVFTLIYVAIATALVLLYPRAVLGLAEGIRVPRQELP